MEAFDELRENIVNRLKRIEGQIRGIQNMIFKKRACREVVSQLRAAIDAVTIMIIDSNIENCVGEKIELQEIKELKNVLRAAVKYR